jgi:ABC-type phosphate transport system auxiliary subunit
MDPTTPAETTPTPTKEIDLVHELEDDIIALVEEREELKERVADLEAQVRSLEQTNDLKSLTMLAMSVLYVCILLAVTDVANNPEL